MAQAVQVPNPTVRKRRLARELPPHLHMWLMAGLGVLMALALRSTILFLALVMVLVYVCIGYQVMLCSSHVLTLAGALVREMHFMDGGCRSMWVCPGKYGLKTCCK